MKITMAQLCTAAQSLKNEEGREGGDWAAKDRAYAALMVFGGHPAVKKIINSGGKIDSRSLPAYAANTPIWIRALAIASGAHHYDVAPRGKPGDLPTA